jgi:hypothetical protein
MNYADTCKLAPARCAQLLLKWRCCIVAIAEQAAMVGCANPCTLVAQHASSKALPKQRALLQLDLRIAATALITSAKLPKRIRTFWSTFCSWRNWSYICRSKVAADEL